ncbi:MULTISPECIES: oxidoreductase [unclassified Peribacillus]|uniref:oxidoreductase n=1 Tax=unclassified Peribacillus TaxID=2675266 RepID=UPI001913122E|nr:MULTISPECIES: oxidoreductase [unclassified Peribacillus]MBK5443704.1 SDR family oxidoreductase [Peribacillus sp. TH24]WMX55201.1 oxidoreductase [Peribacillus sp. R9-11]
MSEKWNGEEMVDVTGKTIVITGANSGIGFETAFVLASKGAEIILAVRNASKGEKAVERITSVYPKADVRVMQLDLSDLSSIRHFADSYLENYDSLSVLINNAGVMIPPYSKTKDGFELQLGSNHLGHFALTGLLLPCILSTPKSRVVTLSSLAAINGFIDFDNLNGETNYKPMKYYGQSKLANLLFARELQNKFNQHQADSISVACHPGLAHTNLMSRGSGRPVNKFVHFLSKTITQPASMGALPTLYAATEPALTGGEYIGPDGKKGRKGFPKKDDIIDTLYNKETSKKLWDISETMTGVKYSFTADIYNK